MTFLKYLLDRTWKSFAYDFAEKMDKYKNKKTVKFFAHNIS